MGFWSQPFVWVFFLSTTFPIFRNISCIFSRKKVIYRLLLWFRFPYFSSVLFAFPFFLPISNMQMSSQSWWSLFKISISVIICLDRFHSLKCHSIFSYKLITLLFVTNLCLWFSNEFSVKVMVFVPSTNQIY